MDDRERIERAVDELRGLQEKYVGNEALVDELEAVAAILEPCGRWSPEMLEAVTEVLEDDPAEDEEGDPPFTAKEVEVLLGAWREADDAAGGKSER